MTRESRLIVVLLVMGGAGVTGLTLVANQYRKALSGEIGRPIERPATRAARLVDGFLEVRRAGRSIAASQRDSRLGGGDALSRYRLERAAALAAHRMSEVDYAAVRRSWRVWHDGGRVDDPNLATAFQARKAEADAAGLGPDESVDDGISEAEAHPRS